MSDYALLQDHRDSDSVAIPISSHQQGQTFACRVQGRRPDSESLALVLKPLPETAEVVAALVPAYNEEASDVLTTVSGW